MRWRSPPLCTSLLYTRTALPLSLFLAAVRITLPHTYTQPLTQTYRTKNRNLKIIQTEQNKSPPESSAAGRVHRFWELIITLETKLTMAVAGWSGSISANRWLTLSVVLPCFLATKPKNLWRRKTSCIKDSSHWTRSCILSARSGASEDLKLVREIHNSAWMNLTKHVQVTFHPKIERNRNN